MKKLVLFGVFAAGSAFAAGFRIDSQSGRAVGMGGAVVALSDDSSANFYNPAGLTAAGRGFEVMAGDTLIIPAIKFTSPGGETTNMQLEVSPPPHVFARVGLLDQLALGIGVFTQFGANGDWPEGWAGQFRARSSKLQTFDVDINLAYRVHPRLSIAAGVNVVRGTVLIERHLDFVDSIGAVMLGGGAWGVDFNAGLRAEIIENHLWFGATARTPVNMTFQGRAHFSDVPAEFQGRIYDQDIKADVTLPLVAQFGLGLKLFDKLKVGLDMTYVDWSSFRELRIQFLANEDLTVPLQKNWWDTASIHVGVEYDLSTSLSARVGFVWDPTPSPTNTLTPELPDLTRIKFALGVGYRHSSGFFVDAGAQIIALASATSSAPGFPGTYSGSAGELSISIGFRRPSSSAAAVETAPAEAPAPAPAEAPAPAPAPGEAPMTP